MLDVHFHRLEFDHISALQFHTVLDFVALMFSCCGGRLVLFQWFCERLQIDSKVSGMYGEFAIVVWDWCSDL